MTLVRLAPAIFVVLWSTGWIIAFFGTRHADPLTFLFYRFLLAAGILWLLLLPFRVRWPKDPVAWFHIAVSGVLLHVIYLGGIWWAIGNGFSTAISGIFAAIQPLLTALLAPYILGERLTPVRLAGFLLGTFSIILALLPELSGLDQAALSSMTRLAVVNFVSMVSVALGFLYQKKYIPQGDLRAVTVGHYVVAAVVLLPAALLLEDFSITWNGEVLIALGWSIFGISFGAIGLLLYLLRHGAASDAAALIYLIPPMVAIEAWLFLGDELTVLQIISAVLVCIAVYLVTRKPASRDGVAG